MKAFTDTSVTGNPAPARSRRLAPLARNLVAGVAVAFLGILTASTASAPLALAEDGCDNVVDTTGSFSMNCAPAPMGDTNGAPVQAPSINDENLTEAEVSEPGWNG
ncbi:hypothetical protein [Mycolicibacterium sp.]|uniref:hypothetical protein n=1 Tax=Mycolicibacterium sp. TaxID=2320850 RepID=UPI001D44EA41|nr:hypothetical protein [Mycolicibacterium sp.]MCB1289982.1 hypothetical protein [Mycobacterium sp.]MCB9408094.1 hypothetical protein [Mycolicibacterium sp.]MCB9424190.1 hypothetical protein [Actinomycetota bacterium]